MKAEEICRKAAELVSDSRHKQHGEKLINHQAIAAVWNGYLLAREVSSKPMQLSAVDVANMMELLKVARRLNGDVNVDDAIDSAGYAAIAGELQGRESTRG